MRLPTTEEQETLKKYIGEEVNITIDDEGTVWEKGIQESLRQQILLKIIMEYVGYNSISGTLLEKGGTPTERKPYGLTFTEHHRGPFIEFTREITEIYSKGLCIYKQ